MNGSESLRPVPIWQRLVSSAVAAYLRFRGQTRLRQLAAPWLVARLESNIWIRATGVVHAEWEYLSGRKKEQQSWDCLRACLRPGMTFVDVGANIGCFSLLAASVVGSTGQVVAFEPTPRVMARLCENIRLNQLSNVILVEAVVTDRAGHAVFFESRDDPEGNSLFSDPSAVEKLEVKAVTLDEELARYKVGRVDLLKVDAEGAEWAVLRGARKTLVGSRPKILLELNPVTLERAGVAPPQLLEWLHGLGYREEEIEAFSWQGARVTNLLLTAT